MGGIEIHVRGSRRVRIAPERATVYASVTRDGAERDAVFAATARILESVRASLQDLRDTDRLRWYGVDQIRVEAHRPWNADGEQLPLVHTATVAVTAQFDDLAALSDWVSAVAVVDGVRVAGIDWTLSGRTRDRLERRARRRALRNARRRAQDYADALGLGRVRVRTVSDAGAGGHQGRPMYRLAMSSSPAPEPSVSLEPQDIEIDAEVEATFVVKGPK